MRSMNDNEVTKEVLECLICDGTGRQAKYQQGANKGVKNAQTIECRFCDGTGVVK
jgi:hypothetical protein